MTRRRKAVIVAAVVVAALAAGVLAWRFTRRPLSDRAQIEGLLDRVEEAVQAKNVKQGLGCLSSDYRDSFGLSKRMVQRLALQAQQSPRTFRVLISNLDLDITGDEAQGRLQVELEVRNGDIVEGDYSGPILLGFRKEGGDWRIVSSGGWQSWVEGYE